MSTPSEEILLQQDKNRFVIFPVKHHDIWDWYKKLELNLWTLDPAQTTEELEVRKPRSAKAEIEYLNNLLAFFAGTQKKVTENLSKNIQNKIALPEAGFSINLLLQAENVHLQAFSVFSRIWTQTPREEKKLVTAVAPRLQKLEKFISKYSNNASFGELLVASAAFNAIFFSTGLSILIFLKKKNIMPGLSNYCDQISRDKSLHRNLVIDLFNDYLQEKVPAEKARQIIIGTRNLSLEIFLNDFPVSLIEMQEEHLQQYVNLVTEDLLQNLGFDKNLAEETAVLSEPNISLAQSRASKLQQNSKKDPKENKEFGEDAISRSQ